MFNSSLACNNRSGCTTMKSYQSLCLSYLNSNITFSLYSLFIDFSIKGGKLDYTNLKAVRLLNSALLLKELNLKVTFPDGHLCPTVPNRTAYIKQIEFILYEIFKIPSQTKLTGIDM